MKPISGILGVASIICFIIALPDAGLWLAGEPLTPEEQLRWPIALGFGLIAGVASAVLFKRATKKRVAK